MKRFLALLAGAFGLGALLRRSRPALSHGPSPADELRTRLAESRSAQPPSTEPEAAVEPGPPSIEDRRADVHNRARGAIDELKS